MATIKEVAELAGVSLTTVSRVLNRDNRLSVTPEVRRRIYQAAYSLDYSTPRQRRRASEKKQLIIGVADWNMISKNRPNISLVNLNCMMKVMRSDIDVSFTRIEYGVTEEIDGIIAFGQYNEEELIFLHSLSQHIVLVEGKREDYSYDQILIDVPRLYEEGLNYLLDEKNYSSVGCIVGTHEINRKQVRSTNLQYFCEVLEKRGIYNERYIHVTDATCEDGYLATKKAAEDGTLARVVVVSGDEVAEGVMKALDELNLRVPEDVALVMLHGILTSENRKDNTTSVEMFPEYVWENAMERLFLQFQQKTPQAVCIWVPADFRRGETA